MCREGEGGSVYVTVCGPVIGVVIVIAVVSVSGVSSVMVDVIGTCWAATAEAVRQKSSNENIKQTDRNLIGHSFLQVARRDLTKF
jgi:hypothetical protein